MARIVSILRERQKSDVSPQPQQSFLVGVCVGILFVVLKGFRGDRIRILLDLQGGGYVGHRDCRPCLPTGEAAQGPAPGLFLSCLFHLYVAFKVFSGSQQIANN